MTSDERLKRSVLATLLAVAALCLPASAQSPVDFRTKIVLREMESIIRPGVQPTYGVRVFVRMYDTHSSIHAHWAAYRIARAIPSLQAIALESESALEYRKVRYEVANHIDYTYAQAWFLRLATEYDHWVCQFAVYAVTEGLGF